MYPSYPDSWCYDEGGELSRTSSHAAAFLQHSQLRTAVSLYLNHLCWDIGEIHRCGQSCVVFGATQHSAFPLFGSKLEGCICSLVLKMQSAVLYVPFFFYFGVVGFLTWKEIPLTLLIVISCLHGTWMPPFKALGRLLKDCAVSMGSTGRRVPPAECSTCVSTSCYYCR